MDIFEAQDRRLRLHKKKTKTDWTFVYLSLLILVITLLMAWTLYVEKRSDEIISRYPEGGKVAITIEKGYWHSYCTTFPDKCIY